MRQKLRELGGHWNAWRVHEPQPHAGFGIDESSTPRTGRGFPEFDGDAWMKLLAEQKLVIAHAAGVDPSHVRIRIGH